MPLEGKHSEIRYGSTTISKVQPQWKEISFSFTSLPEELCADSCEFQTASHSRDSTLLYRGFYIVVVAQKDTEE